MFFPSEFCFLGPAFFYATFFQIVFIEIPSHFLLGTKRFASIEDSLGAGIMRLTGDIYRKIFEKQSFSIFFQRLSVEQEGFPSFKGNL